MLGMLFGMVPAPETASGPPGLVALTFEEVVWQWGLQPGFAGMKGALGCDFCGWNVIGMAVCEIHEDVTPTLRCPVVRCPGVREPT